MSQYSHYEISRGNAKLEMPAAREYVCEWTKCAKTSFNLSSLFKPGF